MIWRTCPARCGLGQVHYRQSCPCRSGSELTSAPYFSQLAQLGLAEGSVKNGYQSNGLPASHLTRRDLQTRHPFRLRVIGFLLGANVETTAAEGPGEAIWSVLAAYAAASDMLLQKSGREARMISVRGPMILHLRGQEFPLLVKLLNNHLSLSTSSSIACSCHQLIVDTRRSHAR